MILALDFRSSVIFISSFSLFRFSFKDPVNKSLFILTIVKMSFAFLSQQTFKDTGFLVVRHPKAIAVAVARPGGTVSTRSSG